MIVAVSARSNTRMETLLVRAWAEPGAGRNGIRARVLAIKGPESETQEVGAAVGLIAILELVAEGLRIIVPVDEDDEFN